VTTDLAYFMGCALTVADRRAHADELIACYHAALGPATTLTLEGVKSKEEMAQAQSGEESGGGSGGEESGGGM